MKNLINVYMKRVKEKQVFFEINPTKDIFHKYVITHTTYIPLKILYYLIIIYILFY